MHCCSLRMLTLSVLWLQHPFGTFLFVGSATSQRIKSDAAGVMHLKQVNPQVPGASGSLPNQLLSQWHLPRVGSAMPQGTSSQLPICGTSAFAFQGTNAHIIQHQTPSAQSHSPSGAQAIAWQRKCHWVAPPASAFLAAVVSIAAGGVTEGYRRAGSVVMEVELTSARAAFLKQYSIMQNAVMPAAGFMHLCTSAAAVMAHNNNPPGMLKTGYSLHTCMSD